MFPGKSAFAFTILDDTDDATAENVEPIYRLLRDLGMRTTKTAWPLDCPEGSRNYFAAETLQNARYCEFVQELVRNGFELASHCATMETSKRQRTLDGLAFFERTFGSTPTVHVNHGQNLENVYWGARRYHTWPSRLVATLFEGMAGRPQSQGHVAHSPYFWGDLCRERFRFIRSFSFHELDVSRIPPGRPYQLDSTPYVQYWFTTADAPDVHAFKALVTRDRIDALARRGGYAIVSTHLGKGFVRDGVLDREVEDTLRYISTLPGWFAPVSELLECLLSGTTRHNITSMDLWRLEIRHLLDRVMSRIGVIP